MRDYVFNDFDAGASESNRSVTKGNVQTSLNQDYLDSLIIHQFEVDKHIKERDESENANVKPAFVFIDELLTFF